MRRAMIVALTIVVAISIFGIGCSKKGSGKVYKLAILPQYSDEVLREKFQPLTDYLAETTGEEFELVFAPDFETHAEWVRTGEVDFGYQNPVVYSKVLDDTELLGMALKENEITSARDRFRGIIVTRVEDGEPIVANAGELPGRKVSVVSFISAGGYVSQMMTLDIREVNADEVDFFEAVGNEQENVLRDVYEGRADAGFVRASTWGMIDDELEDPEKLMIIESTAWLPNWAFCAHKDVDPELAEKVEDALFKIPADSDILVKAKLNGFRVAKKTDYESLRKYVE